MATAGGSSGAAGNSSFAAYRAGGPPLDIRLTIQLVLAARRWRALLDERLRPSEQSAARMEALAAIMTSPQLSPQVEIAKRLRIEGPTLTRMLDALETDGLVERIADPTDRRTKRVRLTPGGERVLEEIFDLADIYRSRLFAGFAPEKLEEISAFLAELLERLDAGLESGD